MCWHRDPFRRPAFSKIVRDVRALRLKVRGTAGVGSGSGSGFAVAGGDVDVELDGDGDDVGSGSGSGGNTETGGGGGVGLGLGVNVNPRVAWAEEVSPAWESPDMRPVDLPPSSPLGNPQADPNADGNASPRSSDESYRTAETGESVVGAGSGKGKRRDSSHHPYVSAGKAQTAHQVYFIPSLTPSRASSIFVQDSVVGRSGVRHESGSDSSEYDVDAVRLGGVGSGIGWVLRCR